MKLSSYLHRDPLFYDAPGGLDGPMVCRGTSLFTLHPSQMIQIIGPFLCKYEVFSRFTKDIVCSELIEVQGRYHSGIIT